MKTRKIPAFSVLARASQRGSMMLEALLAILIFSLGILAVVGMQGSAVKASSDAKYRSDASLLANRLIGEMWATNRTIATLQSFQGGAGVNGTAYSTWLADVQATLPGVGANPPLVVVNPANNQVTITLFWLAPGETEGAAAHQFAVVAQIL